LGGEAATPRDRWSIRGQRYQGYLSVTKRLRSGVRLIGIPDKPGSDF
jgi:hypothetical protein